MMRTLALLCALATAGCGGGAVTAPPPSGSVDPEWVNEDDGLAERARELRERLDRLSVRTGPIFRRGFLVQGQRENTLVSIPAGECLTLVAVASRGLRDLDAAIFERTGERLAEDVEPDPEPALQVCGGETGRQLYYHLSAYDGSGSFLMVSFSSSPGQLERIRGVLGGRPGVVRDESEDGDSAGRARQFTQGAARRGFRSARPVTRVALSNDQSVRVGFRAEAATCYSVAAFASEGIRVQLSIESPDGSVIARDGAGPNDAAVQFCVDQDVHLGFDLSRSPEPGEDGHADLVILEGSEELTGGVSGLWLGERAPFAEVRELSVLRDELVAQTGLRTADFRSLREERLRTGDAIQLRATAQRGVCSRFVAIGARGIRALRLEAASEDGTELDGPFVGQNPLSRADVVVCPDRATPVLLSLVVSAGSGDVEVFELPALRRAYARVSAFPPAVRGPVLRALMGEQGTLSVLNLEAGTEPSRAARRIRLNPNQQEALPPIGSAGCEFRHFISIAGAAELRVTEGDRLAHLSGTSRAQLVRCDAGRPNISAADESVDLIVVSPTSPAQR